MVPSSLRRCVALARFVLAFCARARHRRPKSSYPRRGAFPALGVRVVAFVAACTLVTTVCVAAAEGAQPQRPPASDGTGAATPDAAIEGTIADRQTGLPVSDATVALDGRSGSVRTDAQGRFTFRAIAPGIYRLIVTSTGYQPARSDDVVVVPAGRSSVTLTLQAAPTAEHLAVIGSTSARASESLQRTSTTSRTLTPEALAQSGVYRAGDALRALPGINNALAGDTAALGDDLPLNIRGIGTLETNASLDGHPIAYQFPGGYNFQLSPIVGMRAIDVTYGSGSNLLGQSAIGGIVDFQTIDPAPQRRYTFSQGYGTFQKLATTASATGTAGRLGYALAYGVAGLDGPLRNTTFYQPGAAYDQSATNPATRVLGTYTVDSAAVSRTGVMKLRYDLGNTRSIEFTGVASSYWENKTGNGDADYLEYGPALALGNALLGAYKPGAIACPSGTFVATNANGVANGTGPGGVPDGGSACQTPAQYAANNTGYSGAGPAWQSFNFDDAHLAFRAAPGIQAVRVDLFANRYLDTVDRTFALPFAASPGDSPGRTVSNREATEGGVTASDDFMFKNNTVGAGFSYLNVAYSLRTTTVKRTSYGSPTVHEIGYLVRDVYRPERSPLTIAVTAVVKHASATHSSYVDPRASIVFAASRDNVLRFSAGATTTQPAGNQLGQPFVPATLGGAGGGAAISCGALNSIGSVPSSALHPERGVDEEVAYGHRFGGDSQVQIALYNVNVYDKLYSTIVPLTATGTAFLDPAYLAQAASQIAGRCGSTLTPALIGVTGTFNVGALRSRGFTIAGRQRVDRRTFVDYDWTLDSTAIVSAPVPLLQANLALIPGAQLPRLPLHTLNTSIDHLFNGAVDARFTVHTVSDNNTKRLPAYDYSDLRVSVAMLSGTFSVAVGNVFNEHADIRGLRYEGVPLALNGYATPSAYASVASAAATEQFGLPYRSIFFNYALRTR